jgi:hypothetical protein
MRISMKSLTRPERDTVSGLVIGYRADAKRGIPKRENIERVTRWRRQGWSDVLYHYHILAILIGYAQAGSTAHTIELPGMGGC